MKNANMSERSGRRVTLASMDQKIEKLNGSIQKTKSKYEADKEELNLALKKRDELMKREILNALKKSSLTLEEVLDFIKSSPQESPEVIMNEFKEKMNAKRYITEDNSEKEELLRTDDMEEKDELKFFHENTKHESEIDTEVLEMDRELEIWENRIRTDCFSECDDYCD